MNMVEIKILSKENQELPKMIEALDSYQRSLYPEESNHLDSLEVLFEENNQVLGAFLDDKLVGIGAAKTVSDFGELKRFYVIDSYRGQGIAECVLSVLERWLVLKGIRCVQLETGIYQNAAIKFYEKMGFELTKPFGAYKPDPLSIFMKKNLTCIGALKDERNFYVVVFCSVLKKRSDEYQILSEKMMSLVAIQPGFLGAVSGRNEKGFGSTSSFWQNKTAIAQWKENLEHTKAQQLGREVFYSRYKTYFSSVVND
ncbi:MAG: GNAT family N-acetyltransferase [Bacteriovoracia bacterium]